MGQVIKVWLSCYPVLLLCDSKTRWQDSCTFMTWHIYICVCVFVRIECGDCSVFRCLSTWWCYVISKHSNYKVFPFFAMIHWCLVILDCQWWIDGIIQNRNVSLWKFPINLCFIYICWCCKHFHITLSMTLSNTCTQWTPVAYWLI